MTNEPRWMVVRRWSGGATEYLALSGAEHGVQMFVGDEAQAGLFASFVEAERAFSRWLDRTIAKNPHPWLGTGEVALVRLGLVEPRP
jgi:hypothetical protein